MTVFKHFLSTVLSTSQYHTFTVKKYTFQYVHASTSKEFTSKQNTFSFEWINVSSTKEVLNCGRKKEPLITEYPN